MAAGIISALGCMTFLSAPLFIRQCKCCGGQTEAVSNIRQLGLALFEFEAEYGSFPDPSTIARVRGKTDLMLSMGTTTSNDYFRQLLEAGIASSETMFHTRLPGKPMKPDNIFSPGEALKKGECSFTYLLGARASDNPGRPLVVAPMIPGTDRFDPKAFEGKAIILTKDNRAMSLSIDKHGHAILQGGRNLMDPSNPIWDGHPPTIAWPE